jgi:hypothetical protein
VGGRALKTKLVGAEMTFKDLLMDIMGFLVWDLVAGIDRNRKG